MVIRYISAGDRLNYGDFLFSLIFRQYFQDNFKIKYYGIVRSDYSYFGAIPTLSYKTLVKEIQPEKDVIVIGGGEVFFPKWSILYSFIYPFYSIIKKNKYLNKVDNIINLSKKIFYQPRFEFPFVPNLECENIYISAGGQFNKILEKGESDYLKRTLTQSTFISVRDNRTHLSLKAHGIDSILVPDTAVLLSKIFTLKELTKKVKNKNLKNVNNEFIFLQVGKYKGPENIKKFLSDINEIAKHRNLSVICCPIGIAPGHEDHKLLEQFCRLDSSWNFVDPNNIFEIMYLIAKSEMYIGTSLHGLITAFSFNKPAIALNNNIHKTNSFIETWCSEFYEPAVDYNELICKINTIEEKWNKSKAELQLEYCQNLVESYFYNIHDYLKKQSILEFK